MTVPSETNKSGPYSGNGVTTVFAYGFRILDAAHIQVVTTTAGVDTIVGSGDYSVSGVGNTSGGNITFTTAPATGTSVNLIRNAPFTQNVDLENQGAYYAETVEQAFDLAVMRDQQLAEKLDRSVKIPVGEDASTLDTLIEDIIRLDGSADNIDTVAGIAGNVTTVAGISGNVTTVAGISADVTSVAGVSASVPTVAAIDADVTTVAGISGNVTTVAGVSANVTTVATNIADVNTVAGLTAEIAALPGRVTDAQTAASDAEAALDSFDDRYLGAKATAPTLDNDGNALLTGATYWDTASSQMFTWSGSEWKPTFLTGNTVRSLVTATSGQTVVTTPTYVVGVNSLSVYVNGVKVLLTDDYVETNQNTITFTSGLTASDEVELIALQAFPIGTTGAESVSTVYGVTVARLLALREGTVAELLADTTLDPAEVPVGSVIEAGGFRYEVAASGATDQHVTTAGGVKLYLVSTNIEVTPDALGIPMVSDDVDYTRELQILLGFPRFRFPEGFECSTGPLTAVNNTTGVFSGAKLKLLSGTDFQNSIINFPADAENIIYYGGEFDGNRGAESGIGDPDTQNGGMHCCSIRGGKNCYWFGGPRFINAATDGIYVRGQNIDGFHIYDPYCHNNKRQGISPIGCADLHIYNGTFLNSNGQAPESGIDVEPNQVTDHVTLFFHGKTRVSNNADRGLIIQGSGSRVRLFFDDFEALENGDQLSDPGIRITGSGDIEVTFRDVTTDKVISIGGGGRAKFTARDIECRAFAIGEVSGSAADIDITANKLVTGSFGFSSASASVFSFTLGGETAARRKFVAKEVIAKNGGTDANNSYAGRIIGANLHCEIGQFSPLAPRGLWASGDPAFSKISVLVGAAMSNEAVRVAGLGWDIEAKKTVQDTRDVFRLDAAVNCKISAEWDGFDGRLVRVENAAATGNRITAKGLGGTANPISYTSAAEGNLVQGSYLTRASGTVFIENPTGNFAVGNFPLSINTAL